MFYAIVSAQVHLARICDRLQSNCELKKIFASSPKFIGIHGRKIIMEIEWIFLKFIGEYLEDKTFIRKRGKCIRLFSNCK